MTGRRAAETVWIAAALAGLAAAAGWALRVACADFFARQETLAATEEALQWTPDQAVYHFRLGVLTAEKDPARSIAELERAAALNSWDARSWIELGLRLEGDGKADDAEKCLLRAAEADRQYLPRWTLANFYFRRKDTEKFWAWARASAEMVYGDATSLFRLCGQVAEDGDLVNRIGIARPEVRANYLSYLTNLGRLDIMMPAARKVLEDDREEHVALLLSACDRLLDSRGAEGAMEIWNGLAERHRIPLGPVGAPPIVTNGAFSTAPISHGFDWRLTTPEGVSASGEERPPGLRLTFSGRQPETCELLTQFMLVRGGTAYQLKFAYRTPGIQRGTGLKWRVINLNNGGTLAEGESLSSEDEQQGIMSFRTPADCKLARIALEYRRAPGTTRITGFVVLRGIDVKPGELIAIRGGATPVAPVGGGFGAAAVSNVVRNPHKP